MLKSNELVLACTSLKLQIDHMINQADDCGNLNVLRSSLELVCHLNSQMKSVVV